MGFGVRMPKYSAPSRRAGGTGLSENPADDNSSIPADDVTAPGPDGSSGSGGSDTGLTTFSKDPGILDWLAHLDPSKIGHVDTGQDPTQNGYAASDPNIQKVKFANAIRAMLGNASPDVTGAGANGATGQTNVFNEMVGQGGLYSQLNADANGYGPSTSLAQALMKQATDRNNAQAAGQIASVKGINPALASKIAANQAGMNNQNSAAAANQLDMQNRMAARTAMGNVLTGAGTLATEQRAGGTNAAIGQGSVENQKLASLISGMTGQNNATTAGTLGTEKINADVAATNQLTPAEAAQIKSNEAIQSSKASSGMFGGLLNGVGGIGAAALGAAHGAVVPGKAKVPGDSKKNDTVDAKLSPGEIVVPRSKADDPKKAAEFVTAIIGKKKGAKGYAGVAQAKRELAELKTRMASLEKKIGGAA